MTDLPRPPKTPCGSCPYRRDVPSGVWAREEYEKLPAYDGEIIDQLRAGAGSLFMCHQRDGCLCGGWLLTHGVDNLLALRLNPVDPSVRDYSSDVPVFSSGAEAAEHGVRDLDAPSREARRKVDGLMKLRGVKGE